MKIRAVTLLLLGILPIVGAEHVAAREKTDVLVMRNGDRLTCEIKALKADVLYVSLDYVLGTISVNWFQVDHVESVQPFVIRTSGGEVYSGRIKMPGTGRNRPVEIEVLGPEGESSSIPVSEISHVDQSNQKLLQRFNGSVGLGAIYNKGNQSTQYNLASDISYPRDRWSASVSYNSTLSSNQNTSASSRNQLDASAQRLLPWNHWYYTGFADFLQSTEQGIDLQSALGGGIGRYLKNSNHASISVAGGFAFQRITYQQNIVTAPTEDVASAWLNAQARLFRFDRTSLVVTTSLLPALSDPGRLHFNLNTSYYIKIWGKFNFDVSFYGNWDNQPPFGFSKSDYGASSGLSWTFGNR